MKKLLLLFAVGGMVFGFSSCKDECCDCSNSSVYDGEICEGDSNLPGSNASWNAAKSVYESNGCDCD